MRSDIIRVYKTLHTWTGLIAGMALFIAFFAGALTMFKTPLDRWAAPPAAELTYAGPTNLERLVTQALSEHPEIAKGFDLYLSTTEDVPAPLSWHPGEEPRRRDALKGEQQAAWARLDDNGELEVLQYRPSPVGSLVDRLHQTAGIPGGGHHLFGVYVMGAICALYFLALVSGVIVLLPTLVKDFFALRPGKNRKRFWLDAHNVIGITSLPFHIIMALSVVVFAFHDQIYDSLQKVVYGERPLFEREAPSPPPFEYTLQTLQPPAALLQQIEPLAPQFEPLIMSYSDVFGPKASVSVAGGQTGAVLRGAEHGYVSLNPHTGEVTNSNYLPGNQSTWAGVVTTFFALHFGNFGGTFVRWCYFLLGIGGAFLFYSGNLLWVESRRKKHKRGQALPTQQRNTQWMAAATVGVCWGSVAGVAGALVVGAWLQAWVDELINLYMAVYYAIFLSALAWAFWRGAARALVHLLNLCAYFTLLIPATSAMASVIGSSAWLARSPSVWAVDCAALAIGLLLLFTAKRTRRRIEQGPSDSVWSIHTPAPTGPQRPAVKGGATTVSATSR